jgi:hypothetical protein
LYGLLCEERCQAFEREKLSLSGCDVMGDQLLRERELSSTLIVV